MHFSEPHILQSFLSVHVNRLHQVFMCLLFQGQIINLAFHTCLKGEKKKPQDAQKKPQKLHNKRPQNSATLHEWSGHFVPT